MSIGFRGEVNYHIDGNDYLHLELLAFEESKQIGSKRSMMGIGDKSC